MPIKHSDPNPYVDAFWKWWPELYQKLETLRLTGGEPLLSKDVWRMLDAIEANPKSDDIANCINGKAKFIHGKTLDESNTMYDNIDMFICTSTNDRGPYGIAEAAFCKIPVLSTKTGFALKFKSIKTFETTEEAIQIINELNQDPKKLNSYIEEVYTELTENLSWDAVNQKYWIPVFENHQSLNKR
jgi:glycosyltransferase involved in cell wall biosynthesis